MTSSASPELPVSPASCPSCGAVASGKFCASCGAPLAGATCSSCRAPLTPGAKFCHRCGTPAGATAERSGGASNALPWAVAAIALLALVALAAGQRFARSPDAPPGQQTALTSPGMAGRAPDISSLSPAERAERLYDRIMGAAEHGRVDSVRFFMPMALQAYEALGTLSVDQRYDLGRLAEVAGDATMARAQADTILREQPQHLLGLLLAARAARLRGDEADARRQLSRMARVASAERQKQLPEYLLHQNDIDLALAEWRATGERTMTRTIRVAHSPDSDDAFMFYGLASGKVDTGDIRYVHELQDIETLNQRAMRGELEVTAVSIHAYAYLSDKYALLPHGASMGDRYGPRLVAKSAFSADDVRGRGSRCRAF